jgi:6-phosphogluconolactonase
MTSQRETVIEPSGFEIFRATCSSPSARLRSLVAQRARLIALVPLSLLLASCGGGGGSSPPRVQSLQITPANPTIAYGSSTQFSVVFEPAGSKPLTPVVWESSNPNIASISSSGSAGSLGFAGKGGWGESTITVSVDGLSASTVMTVLPPPPFVGLPQQAPGTFIGDPQPLTMVATDATFPDDGLGNYPMPVTADSWTSSDPAVAKIDSNGVVTPVTPGTTRLTATWHGASNSVVLEVWGTPARFVYVANATSNTIYGFALSIGRTYVSLSAYMIAPVYRQDFTELSQQIPGLPIAAGESPAALAVDPPGRFLFAANSRSNNVSVYSIDASTGALTEVSGSPFASGTAPASVVVDASGTFLYVLNSGDGNVSAFGIDGITGALTGLPGSPLAVGSSPTALLAGAGGTLYVLHGSGNSLSVFQVNGATGALSELAGSPLTTGNQPSAVAEYAGGRFLYVTNQASNAISGFARDAFGSITELAGSPFPLYATTPACPGDQPLGMAVNPQLPLVFVTMKQTVAHCFPFPVEAYQIDTITGALTHAGTGFVVASAGPQNAVVVDSSGRAAWVVDAGSQAALPSCRVAMRSGLTVYGSCDGVPTLPVGAAPTAAVVVR